MNFEALVIDLDQTTVLKGWDTMPSDNVVDAILKAKDKLKVATASGRRHRISRNIWSVLQLNDPCIVSGGAQIIDPKNNEVLWEQLIPGEVISEILRIARQHQIEVAYNSKTIDLSENRQRGSEKVSLISVRGASQEGSQALFKAFSELPDLSATLHPSWRTEGLIDIRMTHRLATKKTAIEKLITMWGITKDKVIGVGDGENDIPMFQAVGFKVAMGNAIDELKSQADYITGSVYEDGLAQFIQERILNEF